MPSACAAIENTRRLATTGPARVEKERDTSWFIAAKQPPAPRCVKRRAHDDFADLIATGPNVMPAVMKTAAEWRRPTLLRGIVRIAVNSPASRHREGWFSYFCL